MAYITEEMLHVAYEKGKQKYLGQIRRKDATKALIDAGMEQGSASDYAQVYTNLISGKRFTRTINDEAAKIFLQRIYQDDGHDKLKIALTALKLHLIYHEKVQKTRRKSAWEVYYEFLKILDQTNSVFVNNPDEISHDEKLLEGSSRPALVNAFERNPKARKKCLDHYGYNCQVCEFNFEERFGEIGKEFIHVHHLLELSEIREEYEVDPINDLRPVCPNCHAMLHKRKPAFSISELKSLLNRVV
ncbi:HNH endonuclease [Jiulongibacter sediminis]|uniref:HNH endonuclease n=1 Tax=Jiulongibacter sediminis TaxID=1605367 RepID=UPI0026EFA919|nr:HNH endonuclease [Jiulongibacter sediminis]